MFNVVSTRRVTHFVYLPENVDMHIQMTRLYQAAEALKKIKGPTAVARALNASPQTINNWEARGMSKSGMLAAQAAFGCSATWLDTGDGLMEIAPADVSISGAAAPAAREAATGTTQPEYGLQWVSTEEYKLLTRYRGTDDEGRGKIMRIAKQMPQKLLASVANNKA